MLHWYYLTLVYICIVLGLYLFMHLIPYLYLVAWILFIHE